MTRISTATLLMTLGGGLLPSQSSGFTTTTRFMSMSSSSSSSSPRRSPFSSSRSGNTSRSSSASSSDPSSSSSTSQSASSYPTWSFSSSPAETETESNTNTNTNTSNNPTTSSSGTGMTSSHDLFSGTSSTMQSNVMPTPEIIAPLEQESSTSDDTFDNTFSSSSSSSLYAPTSRFFQLEEREDKDTCTTEIFLNKDGTVAIFDTDGPPPTHTKGYWKHDEKATIINGNMEEIFTMTIIRTYTTGSDNREMGEFTFDVERKFEGILSVIAGDIEAGTGTLAMEGSMHLVDEFRGDISVGYFSMIDTTKVKLGEDDDDDDDDNAGGIGGMQIKSTI